MHPFIHVFGRDIASYGLMMLLGFGVAFLTAYIRAKVSKYPAADVVYVLLLAVCGGILGSFLFRPLTKLPEIIINFDKYSVMTLGDFLSYWFGELVFYGGAIGGFVAAVWFCHSFKIKLAPIADIIAPAIPLGHAIGRIGCLLGGCCYGIEVSQGTLFSMEYPKLENPISSVPTGVPLLAVPIIEAVLNVCIFVAVLIFDRYKKTPGMSIVLYGALYASCRFVLEFFRGDIVRGVYGSLSTSQIISIGILVFCAGYIAFRAIRGRKKSALPPSAVS